MSFQQDRMPNWATWRLIPNVMIWQAVALSLNIDPEKVRQSQPEMDYNRYFKENREFSERLDVVCANYREINGEQPSRILVDASCDAKVSLLRIAQWARSAARWKTPAEFKKLGKPRPVAGGQKTVRPPSSAKPEAGYRRWLENKMKQYPTARPKPKKQFRAEAQGSFPGLSDRGFERAWMTAIANTGAIAWSKSGRQRGANSSNSPRG